MSRMLRDETPDDPVIRFGAKAVLIGGLPYENSAAKFWTALIDEAARDFPACDCISMVATGGEKLTRNLLYPVEALQKEIDKDESLDLEEAIRQAVEDVSMFGPPSSVSVTLFAGSRELKSSRLPTECADASAFAYLLAWLLVWSNVPDERWNNDLLSGTVSARDPGRKIGYKMRIAFRNEHISEGLYRRNVTFYFDRKELK